MSRKVGLWLTLCGMLFSGMALLAQASGDGTTPPPKVLVLIREIMKPGKAGAPHTKTESAFVQAFEAAKWPQHYMALSSLTGQPRMLFVVGYPTFEAWEADNQATQKNATLAAALERASQSDGDMLSEISTSALVYRDDLSFTAAVQIAHMRYMELTLFHIKPGHEAEWHQLVKMYQDGFKNIPGGHWAMFQAQYGQVPGGTYLVAVPMKSASEVDQSFVDGKKFMETLGPEGMKKLGDLAAACIESSQSNLFSMNPQLSYVPDQWKKSDAFWKVSPASQAKGKKSDAKMNQ